MAKQISGEIWIDGFNLFHRWRRTAAGFQRGADIVHGQDQGVSLLSQVLGKTRSRCTVFMDGGPQYEACTVAGIKLRFPGPGKKADDLMIETIRGRNSGGKVHVVTSDNQLAAALRRHRAGVISVEDFIRSHLQSHAESDAPVPKPPAPHGAEVEYWLREFGESP